MAYLEQKTPNPAALDLLPESPELIHQIRPESYRVDLSEPDIALSSESRKFSFTILSCFRTKSKFTQRMLHLRTRGKLNPGSSLPRLAVRCEIMLRRIRNRVNTEGHDT